MSSKNFMAYGDAETILSEFAEGIKSKVTQLAVMPNASEELNNSIIQYIGNTTQNYTNGYFYKCKQSSGGTYEWIECYVNTPVDISGKVDKVPGKDLSTNDYTDEDQAAVQALGTASTKDVSTMGDAGEDEVVMGNDSRLSDARTPISHTHTKSEITDFPTLGTAAAKNVPSSGNASATEVVLGNDSRLSDARTPVSHTHTLSDISNAGTAAAKNSTNSVTQSSTDLVESGAVHSAIAAAISSVYKPSGDKTCAELVAALLIANNVGNVYNITDSGTTTSDFIGGAGKTINIGDNVAIVNTGTASTPSYKFDLLSGFVDLSNYIQKSSTVGLVKNDGTIDTTQYISDISGKADKVANATNGNFAGLDTNGNLTDSGYKASDFETGDLIYDTTITDCNDAYVKGKIKYYLISSGASNIPETGKVWYVISMCNNNTLSANNYVTQIATNSGNNNDNIMYIRHAYVVNNTITWTDWVQLATDADINSMGLYKVSFTTSTTGATWEEVPTVGNYAGIQMSTIWAGYGPGTLFILKNGSNDDIKATFVKNNGQIQILTFTNGISSTFGSFYNLKYENNKLYIGRSSADSTNKPNTVSISRFIMPAITSSATNGSGSLITSGGVYTALGNKADKVSSATAGDLASLDANGNLVDSGKNASNFISKIQTNSTSLSAKGWYNIAKIQNGGNQAGTNYGYNAIIQLTRIFSHADNEVYTIILDAAYRNAKFNIFGSYNQRLFTKIRLVMDTTDTNKIGYIQVYYDSTSDNPCKARILSYSSASGSDDAATALNFTANTITDANLQVFGEQDLIPDETRRTFLTSSDDLNAITTEGKYYSINSDAPQHNPTDANLIIDIKRQGTANRVEQIVYSINTHKTYTRQGVYYSSTASWSWGSWEELATTAIATTSENGLMSSTDKTKLDNLANNYHLTLSQNSGSVPTNQYTLLWSKTLAKENYTTPIYLKGSIGVMSTNPKELFDITIDFRLGTPTYRGTFSSNNSSYADILATWDSSTNTARIYGILKAGWSYIDIYSNQQLSTSTAVASPEGDGTATMFSSLLPDKSCADATDTSSKIYLLGAAAQGVQKQTYSDDEIYATSGVLTTKKVQVGGTAATMEYNSTNKCIDFIFS